LYQTSEYEKHSDLQGHGMFQTLNTPVLLGSWVNCAEAAEWIEIVYEMEQV